MMFYMNQNGVCSKDIACKLSACQVLNRFADFCNFSLVLVCDAITQ